ncbi:MAG: drug efflux transport system permease protein [Candidatus Binatota bacterium]|jgi:ABC-2 type transport system permease protein|nr:drug efflux transport system permease protein [Candidatus Binatota bacterium]
MKRGPRSFWSTVAAVAYKEAAVLRHDKALLSMVVAQPVMMFLLFGFVLSNEPENVPWAVWDRSGSESARRLIADIEATGHFLPAAPVYGYDAGRRMLANGSVLAFLVIPQDLERELDRGRPVAQLLVDGSEPLSAARVAAYATLTAGTAELRVIPGPQARSRSHGGNRALTIRQSFWFNPALRDDVFFLSALGAMLLTNFCLSATSLALVGERESGTYEQMLALPTTPLELVIGKLVPFVVLSFGLVLYATVLCGLVGLWPRGSFLALLAVTLPFVLASLSVGVFVSTLAHTSAQAVFITVFFIMPSFVLSGVMLPYQLMPHGVREVGGLFPLRWYQIATRRIIDRGAGFLDVLVPFTVLCLLFLVLLAAIRWRLKPRLG